MVQREEEESEEPVSMCAVDDGRRVLKSRRARPASPAQPSPTQPNRLALNAGHCSMIERVARFGKDD
jgi:hypothetical protein